MKLYYQKKGEEYDGSINSRFNLINAQKDFNIEYALLETADASRMLNDEIEVENKYRYILNREKSPFKVKLKALFNYATYLYSHKGKTDKTLKVFHDYYHIFNRTPDFIKNYSNYAWAEGTTESKLLAIKLIKDYFATKPQIDRDVYLDLLGTLMTYLTIHSINEREELKDLQRFGEISNEEYKRVYKEQKDKFNSIFSYPGMHLYNNIKNDDLMSYSPNSRNSILTGLTHFIEICIRRNQWELGKSICQKIIEELPQNFHKSFEYKLKKIESIENKRMNVSTKKQGTESDLSLKLKVIFPAKE